MKLSTDEKGAISRLLQIIAQSHIINNKASDLPLYYIPKPTHSILEIQQASTHYFASNEAGQVPLASIIDSPLYMAIRKSNLAIVNIDNLVKTVALWEHSTTIAYKDLYIVIGGK